MIVSVTWRPWLGEGREGVEKLASLQIGKGMATAQDNARMTLHELH